MSVGTVNASAETVDRRWAVAGRAGAEHRGAAARVDPAATVRAQANRPWLRAGRRAARRDGAYHCKRVWPVSQRDMVLTTAAATRGGAFLRFATSTAHADAPLDADRVRLEVRGSGYLIEPRGASCKVTR